MAMGLVAAGTNNARMAGLLRNLSSYYYKDPTMLFCVSQAYSATPLQDTAPYLTINTTPLSLS